MLGDLAIVVINETFEGVTEVASVAKYWARPVVGTFHKNSKIAPVAILDILFIDEEVNNVLKLSPNVVPLVVKPNGCGIAILCCP